MMGDYTEHLISMAGGDGDDALDLAAIQARDELKKTIYQSHRLNTQVDLQNDRRLQGSQLAWAGYAADAIIAAGHVKVSTLAVLEADIDGELQDARPSNYAEDNYDAGYIAGLGYAQDKLRAALTATDKP